MHKCKLKKTTAYLLIFTMFFSILFSFVPTQVYAAVTGADGVHTFADASKNGGKGFNYTGNTGLSSDGYFNVTASKYIFGSDNESVWMNDSDLTVNTTDEETVYIEVTKQKSLGSFILDKVDIGEYDDGEFNNITVKGYANGVEVFSTVPYSDPKGSNKGSYHYTTDLTPATGVPIDSFRIYYTKADSFNRGFTHSNFMFYGFTTSSASTDSPAFTKVILSNDSVTGLTAGDKTITGLTSAKEYNVQIVGGINGGKYVTATGTVEASPVSITGTTQITGLVNGTTYRVVDLTLTNPIITNVSTSVVIPNSLSATSNKNGTIYLVLKDATITNVESLEKEVTDGRGRKEATTANLPVQIATTGLPAGTYVVYAVDKAGNMSNKSSDIALITPPSAPENLTAIVGDKQVALSWDSVAGATSYKVYKGIDPLDLTLVDTKTELSTVITGLDNGTTYYFAVRASKDGADSKSSNQIMATPIVYITALTTIPVAPSIPVEGNALALPVAVGSTTTPTTSTLTPVWTLESGGNVGDLVVVGRSYTYKATFTAPIGYKFVSSMTGGNATVSADGSKIEYIFTVVAVGPSINIKGKGITIANGASTPSTADDTDFGNVDINTGSVTKTFTIENAGTSSLALSGTPKVSITGANAGDFTVSTEPTSPVVEKSSTTFNITFDPSASGTKSAKVSIANDDSSKNPYNFSIKGTGIASNDATLSNLTISSGAFNESFAPGTTTYTANVINGVKSITVTPTVNESHATVTVSGASVSSGKASNSISLNEGANPISVVVTAQDGTTKTYTITVTRAAAPALTIGTTNPPVGTVGTAYSGYSFTATGGIGTKTYAVTSGSLPAGLSLAADGTLSGTPTTAGTSTFMVEVTDSAASPVKNRHSYTMTINPATYSLIYTAGANGSITGSLLQIVNSGASGSAVTAVANAGYHFVNWSDGVTTATRTDRNVSRNINVRANFAANTPPPTPPTPPIPPTPPTPEEIIVKVTDGDSDNTVSKTVIKRTTEGDGIKKDNVKYAEDKAKETVDALKKEGKNTARIVIPDVKDEVSEAKIEVPINTIDILAKDSISLEIDTENARIVIPKDSVKDLSEKGVGESEGDLYFRVVPIKEENKREEIKERAKKEDVVEKVAGNSDIEVIGRPMTIETNMSQRPVDIILPLKGVTIPTDPKEKEAFLKNIAVFIEHSDGEKVLIKGEVVEYKPGILGLKFRINKFSTFTIIKMDIKDSTPTKGAVERLCGQNRIDTALAIAKATYKEKLSKVILVASDNYPDALAGNVLAYKVKAPILLVGKNNEDEEKIIAYMKENMDSLGTVYILGSHGAVSNDMEEKIKESGFKNISRIGGLDRYETATKIVGNVDVKEGTPVFLVSGENYPDALSISSIASIKQYPILMVKKDEIPEVVKKQIVSIKPSQIYIIGLQGAISTKVENSISQIIPIEKSKITRIGGLDRFETSLEVAKYFNLTGNKVSVASGNNFPDALTGSVYAAKNNQNIILVNKKLSDNQILYLKNSKFSEATIFGGEAVVNKDIQQQISKIVGE